MARTITISGGKGGVGKTNISVNLSLCLSNLGFKVCLFDADLGLANINILLGLYPEYNLEDVILNEKSLSDIIIKNYNGIDIIPGSSGVEKIANLNQDELNKFIQSFSELDEYDFLIFDTSAGISKNVISFCLAASEVVLVITPEPTSLTDAYALLKILCLNQYRGSAKAVINQCKNTKAASLTYKSFNDVVKKYLTIDIAPLGIIVQDDKFPEAVRRQQPLVTLFPTSNAAKCINVMASRLIKNQSEDFMHMGVASFWTRFVKFAKSPLKLSDKEETQNKDACLESKALEKAEGAINRTGIKKEDIQEDRQRPDTATQDNSYNKSIGRSSGDFQILSGSEKSGKGSISNIKDRYSHPLLDKIEFSCNLPTLPHILLKLIETCGKEEISIHDIGKITEKDPSLCTKILRLVNSAHYSLPKKVKNFNHALTLLGIDTIRNIAVSASICQIFNGLKVGSAFNLKQFWWHSLMCAVIAGLIAKKTSHSMPDETFLSGLLHDIGKLVLLDNYPEEYNKIVKASANDSQLYAEEEKLFGITHCEAGARLVNHWHLQPFIGDAILYHHEPSHRILNALPIVKITYVANSICNDNFYNKENKFEIAKEIFGLNSFDVEEIIEQAETQVKDISEFFDISIEPPSLGADLQISEKDLEKQASLLREVRDMSLILGTLHNLLNAHDINAILHAARQGLQIVFDIKECMFFLYDKTQNVLTVANDNNNKQNVITDELTIPFKDGKSMLVASLKEGKITDSFSYGSQFDLTIIDEQIIHLTGKNGIYCFPMVVQKQYVGVMVLGLDKAAVSQIKAQENLFNRFISYTAFALHAENVRESQVKMVFSERMAASTSIAKRVAHEINNPLSIIKNYLKILEINLSEQNIVVDEIKIISEEIDRVSLTIEELSDISRNRVQNLEEVDLNALLKNISELIKESLSESRINLYFDMDPGLPYIVTDKNNLKKVFINLIKNASEALTEFGNIYVSTRFYPGKNIIETSIKDDGSGLPDMIKSRLFEPYITTKGEGHTGLGLSIAYSTIKSLKGNITCSTEKGKGTTFKIILPMSLEKK